MQRSGLLRSILTVSFVLAATATRVGAAPLPLLDAPGTEGPNAVSYTLGYELTTGATPLTVTSLGVWDQGADGLIAAHGVGLFSVVGDMLGQAAVPAGTGGTLLGTFRYADLTVPIVLLPNTTYVLAAAYDSDDAYGWYGPFGEPVAGHVTADVTIGYGRNEAGSALQFPTGTTGAVYTGPNFIYTAVPEPAVVGMFSIAGLAFLRRRRPTA
ncbi:MAG TPA: PEP-CTERM sorting domain-containing protein [Tepidisphaeraceae bacterium]|jgi:hypothetical protein|nr:PEP-CTERM sorting domain-containing protein [Tepidisphaeraceae bacterium]